MTIKDYPDMSRIKELVKEVDIYRRIKHEYGAEGTKFVVSEIEEILKTELKKIKELPIDEQANDYW